MRLVIARMASCLVPSDGIFAGLPTTTLALRPSGESGSNRLFFSCRPATRSLGDAVPASALLALQHCRNFAPLVRGLHQRIARKSTGCSGPQRVRRFPYGFKLSRGGSSGILVVQCCEKFTLAHASGFHCFPVLSLAHASGFHSLGSFRGALITVLLHDNPC